jgi:hypothetical protein
MVIDKAISTLRSSQPVSIMKAQSISHMPLFNRYGWKPHDLVRGFIANICNQPSLTTIIGFNAAIIVYNL